MQILAEVDARMGTPVDLAEMLDLLVLTLNTTVSSKGSKIGKSYSHCGPSFSKETKSLKTLPMVEELETIFRHGSCKPAKPKHPSMGPN
jgi:hypothetical protein